MGSTFYGTFHPTIGPLVGFLSGAYSVGYMRRNEARGLVTPWRRREFDAAS